MRADGLLSISSALPQSGSQAQEDTGTQGQLSHIKKKGLLVTVVGNLERSPKRHQFLNNTRFLVIFFNGTAAASDVHLLRLNTLRGYKNLIVNLQKVQQASSSLL